MYFAENKKTTGNLSEMDSTSDLFCNYIRPYKSKAIIVQKNVLCTELNIFD